MTGHDYEHLVARYLRSNGYSRVTVTKASGDYGSDVIAYKDGKKYAIQFGIGSRRINKIYKELVKQHYVKDNKWTDKAYL